MNIRRARSIEALGLVVVLWGMGRASVIYFSDYMKAQPAQRPPKLVSSAMNSDIPNGLIFLEKGITGHTDMRAGSGISLITPSLNIIVLRVSIEI